MSRSRFASVAVGVAALTLAARVMGFGRWLVFSKTVGDTCLGDAYNAANLLPNVLFEIVAGGLLAGVVVPVVARHVGAGRSEAAERTSSALITWTMLVLTLAAAVALLGAHRYGAVFSATSCPSGAATVAALLAMFVPQIWLYGLAVVSAGILQAHHRFLAAAVAPLLSSVVVITVYLVYAALTGPAAAGADLARLPSRALQVLGWGTTSGVAALALATLVPLSRLGLRLRPRLRFAEGDTGVIVRIAAAAGAGLVAQQLSLLLISWAAKQSGDPGALTRFSWANAVYLLPFAVLVAPLLQTTFPRLSSAAEQGDRAVTSVLAGIAPPVVVLASLGGALLLATSVPVARIFVLGPGSGRTYALAWPIAALAPAVLGFAILGLASRALLAQHAARSAGIATVVAWGVVIVAVLGARRVVSGGWLVPSLSAAVSLGMLTGALVGWVMVVRRSRLTRSLGMARPLLVAAPTGLLTGGAVAWVSRGLADAGLGSAVLGAFGCAAAAMALFVAIVFVADRRLLEQVWALRTRSVATQTSGSPA